jgi:hypothetical protein
LVDYSWKKMEEVLQRESKPETINILYLKHKNPPKIKEETFADK